MSPSGTTGIGRLTLPQGSAYVQTNLNGGIVRRWDNGCARVDDMECLAEFQNPFCEVYGKVWHELERKAYAFADDWNSGGPRRERVLRREGKAR